MGWGVWGNSLLVGSRDTHSLGISSFTVHTQQKLSVPSGVDNICLMYFWFCVLQSLKGQYKLVMGNPVSYYVSLGTIMSVG